LLKTLGANDRRRYHDSLPIKGIVNVECPPPV